MRFRFFAACVVSCALFVSGCGSILIRPAADNVKTVALVSVYMNRDFYDVKAPRTSVNLGSLNPLGQAVIEGSWAPDELAEPYARQFEYIIAHGIAAYSDRLEGIGNWRWLPAAGVLSNDAYRKFADSFAAKPPDSKLVKVVKTLKQAEWYTAKNMVRIPVEKVVQVGQSVQIGNLKDPLADVRLKLAGLCKDLNVDAVAILEFDMAYTKPLVGADIFSGIPAVPSVSSMLVLVNKDGKVAVNSGAITKGQGKRFNGKCIGMLRQDRVHFDEKSMDSYCLALDRSAENMKQRLTAAFSRK